MTSELMELKLQKIEENLKQIDRLDYQVYNLNQKLEKAMNLLMDMVENKKSISIYDIDYVFLKLNIDGTMYHELPLLIIKAEKSYRSTGEFPTIQKFHQSIMEKFSLNEEEQKIFTLEVTKKVLEEFKDKDEDNIHPVCRMILSTCK